MCIYIYMYFYLCGVVLTVWFARVCCVVLRVFFRRVCFQGVGRVAKMHMSKWDWGYPLI